ncbi:glycine receptor subunit alpha-2-like [Branchiostoma lanceolatum]|uniref:glycine receptor subunit alpha-2-like n=1 Tax=Branchiostoma lanceolatum TaxID=7740 RepID=UPI003451E117
MRKASAGWRYGKVLAVVWILLYAGTAGGESPRNSSGASRSRSRRYWMLRPPEGYQYTVKPPVPDRWLNVTVAAHLQGFGSVSEETMDFQATIQIVREWRDPRLLPLPEGRPFLPVDPGARLWTPHIDFSNLKEVKVASVPHKEFQKEPNMWVTADGNVNELSRYEIKVTCSMSLQNYPLDNQLCSIRMDGFEGVLLAWGNPFIWGGHATEPLLTDATAIHSQFRLREIEIKAYVNSFDLRVEGKGCKYSSYICDYRAADACLVDNSRCADTLSSPECDYCTSFPGTCDKHTKTCNLLAEATSKTFTSVEIQLHLSRRLAYHLMQMYIPSTSIVIMSWVSFWFSIDTVPARVCLGVTTVLTMTAQSSRTAPMPEVSYVRAVDIWVVVCQLFVIAALLEYAAVDFIRRREEHRPQSHNNGTLQVVCTDPKVPDPASSCRTPPNKPCRSRSPADRAKRIDYICRVAFPTLFILFNIFYWPFYLCF